MPLTQLLTRSLTIATKGSIVRINERAPLKGLRMRLPLTAEQHNYNHLINY